MIPVVQPGYGYEGKGAGGNALVFPTGDTFSAFLYITATRERREVTGLTVTQMNEWLATLDVPQDMVWTSKEVRSPTWERGEDGYVYFISDEDGFIKIGRALKPHKRLASFQVSHRQTLTLLATIPGGVAKESEMHRRFASSRHRGEWFAPSSDLLAFIAESA